MHAVNQDTGHRTEAKRDPPLSQSLGKGLKNKATATTKYYLNRKISGTWAKQKQRRLKKKHAEEELGTDFDKNKVKIYAKRR